MRKILIAAAATALATAGTAVAGGWATAGVAPPPEGISAGETWQAEVTILQHGRTPLDGVKPSVIISNGKEKIPFEARPTGEPGKYAANVKFPSGGEWSYAVHDGFTRYGGAKLHTFAPVHVAPGAAAADGLPIAEIGAGVALAGLLAAALVLLARRRGYTARAVPSQ